MQVTVTGLFTYPVKSFRGVSQAQLGVSASGVADDRRWMLVDANGKFLTQRQLPAMATIAAQLLPDGLCLEVGTEQRLVPIPGAGSPSAKVSVWQDECLAAEVDDEVNRWLSGVLGRPCQLVFLPAVFPRIVHGYAANQLGFADGYPLLLTTESSLAALNRRLTNKGIDSVSMSRFRPNLVVADDALPAFAEDCWQGLTLGNLRLVNAKPCGRCMVVTTDQLTGGRQAGREPLATLREFRTDSSGEVLFGINLVSEMSNSEVVTIALGDQLQIEEHS